MKSNFLSVKMRNKILFFLLFATCMSLNAATNLVATDFAINTQDGGKTAARAVSGGNPPAISKPTDARTLLFCDTFTTGKSSEWIEEFGEKPTQLLLQNGVCGFHMDYGDPLWAGYARAELHIPSKKIDLYRGGHFIHFRLFIPTGFVLDAASDEIINQIHGKTENFWGSPNVTMRISKDKINIQTAVYPAGVKNPIKRQKLYEAPITKGAWVSWIYYFNAAGGGSAGRMKAWKNGSLVIDYTGVVSDAYKDFLEWKMGLYKPSWASSSSNVSSRDLKYDDIYIWDE